MMNVAGAMIAKKVIQLLERVGNVLIPYAVDHIQPLAGMSVEKPQMVRLCLRARALREKGRAERQNT